MTKSKSLATDFNFKGKLVTAVFKKYDRVKYLKLATEQQIYWIKVAKNIREDIVPIVSPEAELIVRGTKKQKLKTGKVEYKADYIELVTSSNHSNGQVIVPDVSNLSAPENKVKAKAKVLVCKKSSCWKKGGREVCQVLENICGDRSIEVKTTGCLKQCKKGPNLIMMPDKTRYSKVKSQQIPSLVEKHLLVT